MAGLYIHVPFCQKRCLYCDFYSNTDMGYQEAYLSALIREMELRKNYLEGETLETIYFGGGTPSQLSVENLNRIFEAIFRHFPVNQDMEITLEANPDDMTPAYVAALCSLPVNRISMGVQSFDAADLKFLNRRHDREEALRAVRLCQEHNLYNISIDLIYGLPGQTPEKWQKNLDEVLRLDIPHISAYHLIYEEGTALYRLLEAGKITAVDEETSLELFTLLIENLSAHSYNGTEREWNVASLPEWIKGIQTGKPALENEQLDENTCYNEYIMTHLRTMWGIDLNELSEKFGEKKLKYCLNIAQTYEKRNLLLQKDGKLTLTKEGIFVSDGIMSDLLWV